MQESRRKKPQLKTRLPLPVGTTLLKFYAEGREFIVQHGAGNSIDVTCTGASKCSSPISKIDRIIFYDDKGETALLVLDVVPDAQSQAQWADQLTILSALRCYLESVGVLELTVRCGNTGVYELGFKRADTYKDVFNGEKKTLAEALNASKLEFTKQSTFSSNVVFSIASGFDLQGPPCSAGNPGSAPKLFVSFTLANDVNEKVKQFLIEIKTTIPQSNCAQAFDVPAYLEPDTSGKIKKVNVSVSGLIDWVFVQRPAREALELGLKPREQWNGSGEWILEFTGVSAQAVRDEEIKKFNSCADKYVQAVKAISGGLSVSFVPKIQSLSGTWMVVYRISDHSIKRDYPGGDVVVGKQSSKPGQITVEPSALIPGGPGSANATLPQCFATSGNAVSVQIETNSPSAGRREQLRGLIIHANVPAHSSGVATIRMGSLNVALRGDVPPEPPKSSSSEWMLRCNLDGSISTNIDALLYATQITPGGQDDIPGEEYVAENTVISSGLCSLTAAAESSDAYVEARFRRSKPLVIPLKSQGGQGSFLLRVREQTTTHSSRTLRFDLENAPVSEKQTAAIRALAKKKAGTKSSARESVLVLDSDPFLVAKVEYTAVTELAKRGGALIAQWSNSNVDGTGWQIRTESEPFDFYLPPQAMGEAMVKDDKQFALPADFRLGYPTHARLDNAYFQQRFAEVPWNLRRLLGYPGQRDPGTSLKSIELELIYGLTCNTDLPFVRLAEVGALAGGLPGRMPPVARPGWFSEEEILLYDTARKTWADNYARYLSRLAVLEPWDSHVEGSLILKNLSCEIRYPQTDPAYPKPQHHVADLADPIHPDEGAGKLRGGVTWGFESQNVFNAVMRNLNSNTASASKLFLSSLGGWGHEEATFDEGRTTVYGDVDMARTYYYKLERVGRICVWWNRAKHVIVYERSVVPSRQFYLEQGKDTYGVPLLRKVEEYIEILDEERRYPDDKNVDVGTSTSPDAEKLADRRCAFVAACVFPVGTRIKVSSSWGTDVDATGWKVPLWRKGAVPADVYPFPQVSLSMRSQFGDSDPETPCDFANPETLFFYTDTRPGTGNDPDKWGPVLNLDYVDLPRPRPSTSDFAGGDPRQFSPTDVDIPGGYSPCTFLLKPPLRPANIVANRVDKPMAAVLNSVTLQRAKYREVEKQFTGDAAKLAQLQTDLAQAWKTVLVQAASLGFDLNLVSQAIDQQFDNWFAAFLKDYADVKNAILKKATELDAAVLDYENKAIEKLKNQIRYGASVPPAVGQLLTGTERILQDVKTALNNLPQSNVPAYLHDLVTAQFAALQERVLHTNAAPGLLASVFRPYAEAAASVVKILSARVDSFIQQLGNSATLDNGLRLELISKINSCQEELAAVWSAANVRLQQWLPSMQESVEANLNTFVDAWKVSATKDLQDAVAELQKQVGADVNKVKGFLIQAKARFDQSINDKISDFAKKAEPLLDSFVTTITLICDPNDPKCKPPYPWANDAWNALITLASQGNAPGILNKFNELLDATNTSASNLFTQVDTLRKSLEAQRNNYLQPLLNQQLTMPLKDLEEITKSDVKNWLKARASDVNKALEALRDKTCAAVQEYFGRYIEVLRGADQAIATEVSSLLSLVRAFGDPPRVPGLDFARDKLAYFFNELPQIQISPALGNLLQPSSILDNLKALNISLPTLNLGDRLLPANLPDFDLSTIFPNFAGLDLSSLFQNLKMSSLANDNVKISHGVDPQSKSAWAQADITEKFDDYPIFDRGPLSLRLAKATLSGTVRVEGGLGKAAKRAATGVIHGDWKVLVSSQEIVTLRDTELTFDDAGGIRFNVNPHNVELPGVMAFLTEYLGNFSGSDSGLSIGFHDNSIEAVLNLPIPDMQFVAFGISNLSLGARFGVGLDSNAKFKLTTGFNLASQDRPFGLTIFILGGSGYINAWTEYVPSVGPPSCGVALGIMASATLAISLGPISGGVYVYFGVQAAFDSRSGSGLTIGIVFLIRGEVNILGLISACVALSLRATYENGQLIGRGTFSIEIKICWCFTLHVETEVTYKLAGSGSGQSAAEIDTREPLYASLRPGPFDPTSDMDGDPAVLPLCSNPCVDDFVRLTQEP